jgi:hypothetical protein
MGLDQHRAQITAEWLDTVSGEISRTRITPADRAGVRRFATRFRDQELDVALEATTGWRLSSRSYKWSGRRCNSPSRRRPRRGANQEARQERSGRRPALARVADGRAAAGVVDSPEHLLDLRAQVRLRHTLVDARREWQQPCTRCSITTEPLNPAPNVASGRASATSS